MPPVPTHTMVYRADGEETLAVETPLRALASGEVLVEVAGSALGEEPGAEIAGVVIAAGDATGEWTARRVIVPRVLPCGECDRCRRGRCFACAARASHGAVARHAIVPARYLVSVEPPLWPEGGELWRLAALSDAAATAHAAIVRAQIGPGDVCLIVGAGVSGRLAAALARDAGALVAILDDDAARRARAAPLADVILDGSSLDALATRSALESAATAAGRRPLEMRIIETTRTTRGRERALELLGTGDTCVLIAGGSQRGNASAPLASLALHEAQVIGVHGAHPDLLPELVALVVRGRLRFDAEVVRRPFAMLGAALAEMRAGQLDDLVIVTPDSA